MANLWFFHSPIPSNESSAFRKWWMPCNNKSIPSREKSQKPYRPFPNIYWVFNATWSSCLFNKSVLKNWPAIVTILKLLLNPIRTNLTYISLFWNHLVSRIGFSKQMHNTATIGIHKIYITKRKLACHGLFAKEGPFRSSYYPNN